MDELAKGSCSNHESWENHLEKRWEWIEKISMIFSSSNIYESNHNSSDWKAFVQFSNL